MIIHTKSKILFEALTVIALCSLVGLFSGLSWFCDLFNHYRPHAILTAIILLLPALILKDKGCTLLALAIIALNGSLITERLLAFPATQISSAEENTRNISVLFSNVLTSNPNHQSLMDTVSKNNPDVVVTTEVNYVWTNALKEMEAAYPHSLLSPRPDNFGMAVYSRLPFKGEILEVGEYQLPLMVLDFDAFTLIAAHPIPPLNDENNKELFVYMKKIAEVVENTQKPIVLVGDFNATLWSNTISDLRGLNLMRTNQLGLAWTWPTSLWPLAVQIDHIFVRDAVAADFEVLPPIGSDHFPVKSRVTITN